MLENPGDELYFGEVYRTILQEAWLPEGSAIWQRTGISRRGRRPTQQGPGAQSPTPSQADIRRCFSLCTANWRQLPWSYPPDHPCYGTATKDFWLDEKINKAIPCSYYDYYMRCCLTYCLVTGCILPEANCYVWDPTSIEVAYHPDFLPIHIIGGTPPFEWSSTNSDFRLTFIITTARDNWISMIQCACGETNVLVTDSCARLLQSTILSDVICEIVLEADKYTLAPSESTIIRVVNPTFPSEPFSCYTWEILSGGGSLMHEEGVINQYTAPAIQPDCENLPIVRCSVNDLNSTVKFSVNSWTGDEVAFIAYKYSSPCANPDAYCNHGVSWVVPASPALRYRCDGTLIDQVSWCGGSSCGGSECFCGPGTGAPYYLAACAARLASCNGRDGLYFGQYLDVRTQEMIDGGCCPRVF